MRRDHHLPGNRLQKRTILRNQVQGIRIQHNRTLDLGQELGQPGGDLGVRGQSRADHTDITPAQEVLHLTEIRVVHPAAAAVRKGMNHQLGPHGCGRMIDRGRHPHTDQTRTRA